MPLNFQPWLRACRPLNNSQTQQMKQKATSVENEQVVQYCWQTNSSIRCDEDECNVKITVDEDYCINF